MDLAPLFVFFGLPWAYLSGAIIRGMLLAPLRAHPVDPSTCWQFTLSELMGLVLLLQLPMGMCAFVRWHSPNTMIAPMMLGGMLTAALAWRIGQRALARSDVPPGLRRITLLTVAIPLGLLTALAAPILGLIVFFAMFTLISIGTGEPLAVMALLLIADVWVLFFCAAFIQGAVDRVPRRSLRSSLY